MSFKPGDWIILKEEYIEKCKQTNLAYSKYAEKISENQTHWCNSNQLCISRKGKSVVLHPPNFRLATKEEIRIGKIKSCFV